MQRDSPNMDTLHIIVCRDRHPRGVCDQYSFADPLNPPVQLVLSVVGVLFTARILESAWGTIELLQYIAIVAFSSGCALFVTCLALYLAAPALNSKLLYADLAGFHGVLGALLVGIKQALPDKEAKLFSFVRIPSKVISNASLPTSHSPAAIVL